MAGYIPLSSRGNSRVSVDTGNGVYSFHGYYSGGIEKRWLLDIFDGKGNLLLGGLTIVEGAGDLLKGQGDLFGGAQLLVLAMSGNVGDPAGLGSKNLLAWINPGEENPWPKADPMETINAEGITWRS